MTLLGRATFGCSTMMSGEYNPADRESVLALIEFLKEELAALPSKSLPLGDFARRAAKLRLKLEAALDAYSNRP